MERLQVHSPAKMKILSIHIALLAYLVFLPLESTAHVNDANQDLNVTSPLDDTVQVVVKNILRNSSLNRQKRQFGFDYAGALANAGSRTGFRGAEAAADAQTANFNSGPGFGFSGSNANANSFGQPNYSSANANANAFSQGFGENGFGSSAANAQAQSFESGGPFGSFGASAANSASQGLSFGPGGPTGSASLSGSQTYKLLNGKQLSISYSNGFSIGKDGNPSYSGGQAISTN